MIASITRAIKPAARSVGRGVDAPRRPSRLPQRDKNRFRISRFECQIDRAGVFVVKENFLPALSTIFRTEDAALLVRPVSMTQRRHKNLIRIARVHDDPPNLPRVL